MLKLPAIPDERTSIHSTDGLRDMILEMDQYGFWQQS